MAAGTCHVCCDELPAGVAEFVPRGEEGGGGGEEGGAFRLPCGHAFHPACVIGCLWRRPGCPLCRSGARPPLDEDEEDDGEEEDEADEAEEEALSAQLRTVRSVDAAVRDARTAARAATRAFNLERQRLREARKGAVAAALSRLRREARPGWLRLEAATEDAWRNVHEAEQDALTRRFGEAARSIPPDWLDYALPTEFSLSLEPTQRRFWCL